MMHTDLLVYQESLKLVKDVFQLTKSFPKDEQWALSSQMKRAAISIPSNIAEGSGRRSHKELSQHLNLALGSLTELETQIEISVMLDFLRNKDVLEPVVMRIQAVKRMLLALQKKISDPSPSPSRTTH